MLNKIILKNISIYAYHGCMEQEAAIGAYYSIDVEAELDFSAAEHRDDLSTTISYAVIHDIIVTEMAIRQNLLETLIYRIYRRLRSEFPQIKKLKLKISKLSPPMNGSVESASVVLAD